MNSRIPTDEEINLLIARALEEDIGIGDVTTDSILEDDPVREAVVTAKESMVLCGIEIFKKVFLRLEPGTQFPQNSVSDGATILQNGEIITVRARCSTLLKGERTALNILQRLSGIATLSRHFVEAAGSVKILDTRKTTPGLRVFEKYAVRCGGGENHRFGLFDAVLIKDNHIRAAGSITEAVARVRKKNLTHGFVEVETTNLDEVKEALSAGVDIIMLDNMGTQQICEAVQTVAKQTRIEVSGSMNLERVRELSSTGIDFISVGALTHSVKSIDISMNFS